MILLIAASGLFDFDLTFLGEALLFTLLSLVITSKFLAPVSKQIDDRDQYVDYNLRKSIILLSIGYEKLVLCINLLSSEVEEMNRQIRVLRLDTSTQFEEEVFTIQKKNSILLGELKGDLAIKSAYLFSNISENISSLTDTFFNKKFQLKN